MHLRNEEVEKMMVVVGEESEKTAKVRGVPSKGWCGVQQVAAKGEFLEVYTLKQYQK